MIKPARSTRALELIDRLFTALDAAGVRHCHWKSTAGLPDALAGLTDLDLLVAPSSSAEFASVVAGLDFKRFISHPSRRLPGVEDWLGLDVASRRLVHLHVYHQLILGEELVKNHHLPIEDALLTYTTRQHGIAVPIPELELAVLTVRALLKYREDAFIRDLLPVGHRSGLSSGILEEVRELLTRTTPAAVGNAVVEHVPILPSTTIVAFLEELAGGHPHPRRLRDLRRELERALRPWRRHGDLSLVPLRIRNGMQRSRVARLGRRVTERLRGRASGRRKVPTEGGRAIAIIGIDGAGKSTVVAELVRTFGWRINVATLYLGSARPGRLTGTAQAAARGARRASGWLERRLGVDHRLARSFHGAALFAGAVRAVVEARERSGRAAAGRELASKGWVVLFDRYPMPTLRVGARRMDAHRISASEEDGWLLHRLAQRERAIYRDVPRPDAIVVLRLDADTARRRKGGQAIALDEKAGALRALGEGDATMSVVDASAPLEEVLRQVTVAVWERL